MRVLLLPSLPQRTIGCSQPSCAGFMRWRRRKVLRNNRCREELSKMSAHCWGWWILEPPIFPGSWFLSSAFRLDLVSYQIEHIQTVVRGRSTPMTYNRVYKLKSISSKYCSFLDPYHCRRAISSALFSLLTSYHLKKHVELLFSCACEKCLFSSTQALLFLSQIMHLFNEDSCHLSSSNTSPLKIGKGAFSGKCSGCCRSRLSTAHT